MSLKGTNNVSKTNSCLILLALISQTILFAQKIDDKLSTAAVNVEILEKVVHVPYSSSSRTLRIYLPPSYQSTNKQYPVIYMLDGQNLFDEQTAYAGEWGVDEVLNHFSKESKREVIVVGIDNHGVFRMQEYNVVDHPEFGKEQGKAFTELLVDVIKPLIDKRYRTLSNRQNTAIVGSSMGGLMSFYALMTYPEVFSKAGVYSPAFWVSDYIYEIHKKNPLLEDCKIHMLVGSEEGGMVPVFQKMQSILSKLMPPENFLSDIVEGGTHGEALWSEQFKTTYEFFYNQ